jgi:hypothetical protein
MMKILVLYLITFSHIVIADDFMRDAQELLMPIKKAFMGELKNGMKKGPYNAISACHLKAPHIIEGKHTTKYDFGRTSHKLRSLQNKPDEWLVALLSQYQNSSAKKPMKPQVVKVAGKKAYVEPIYIKPVCLSCHGNVKGSVKKRLDSLYPKDEATGFKLGEFRGLFWLKER